MPFLSPNQQRQNSEGTMPGSSSSCTRKTLYLYKSKTLRRTAAAEAMMRETASIAYVDSFDLFSEYVAIGGLLIQLGSQLSYLCDVLSIVLITLSLSAHPTQTPLHWLHVEVLQTAEREREREREMRLHHIYTSLPTPLQTCRCTGRAAGGLRASRSAPCRHLQIALFIYLIRQMAANSKIHNQHKSQ